MKFHPHPARECNLPLPLSESDGACSSDVSDENDGQHTMSMETSHNCDNLWDSDSLPSPSTSAAFEEAFLVMTLAEKFDLTRLKPYQRQVIQGIQENTIV